MFRPAKKQFFLGKTSNTNKANLKRFANDYKMCAEKVIAVDFVWRVNDKIHRAKPLPRLYPGQPVWLKAPKTEEGVVLPGDSQNRRSVPVQSSSGHRTRRNRAHLRVRKGQVPVPSLPKDTASLPTLGKPETVDSNPHIPDLEETINPVPNNASVVNPAQPRTVTRSGRVVKPLVKESM